MLAEVKEVIAPIIGVPAAQIPDDASIGSLPGWTSLTHLELMLVLESRFNLKIPAAQMLKLQSLREIVSYIQDSAHA